MLHLKLLGKEGQAKPKTNRRREIIKINAKIKETEIKNIKINETKSLFFQTINKIDKPQANLTKMQRERPKLI
jgi:hypothetical protein